MKNNEIFSIEIVYSKFMLPYHPRLKSFFINFKTPLFISTNLDNVGQAFYKLEFKIRVFVFVQIMQISSCFPLAGHGHLNNLWYSVFAFVPRCKLILDLFSYLGVDSATFGPA